MSQRFSEYDRKPNDLYETPAWVTEVLVSHLPFRVKQVWERAAGGGCMVVALRRLGLHHAWFVWDHRHEGPPTVVYQGGTLRAVRAQAMRDRDEADRTNQRPRPSGNSTEAALRRLRKDRPDLHARVLAGEITPHAGMIAAGFRKQPV